MFTDAWRELRHHPGRVVATLIAIAISVGFMVAVSVFLETEKVGLARQLNRQYAAADVLVNRMTSTTPDADVIATIEAAPGTDQVEAALSGFSPVESGDTVIYLQLFGTPSEDFRWASLTEGSWPGAADQIALPGPLAEKLGVQVGGEVTMGEQHLRVSGLTDDPPSRLINIGYVSHDAAGLLNPSPEPGQDPLSQTFLVKATDGTSPDDLVTQLASLTGSDQFTVETADSVMAQQVLDLSQGVDTLKYALMVFAAIALLVGMIIIANTFTILIAQRRRQIGLLRAVGASTGQVRRKFVAEALMLGLVGSLLGVGLGYGIAAIGSTITQSLHWGLALPWRELLIEVAVGIVITVLAALAPIWRTARIAPLEALRPVLSADSQKRVSRVRAIICTVLLALGVVLAVLSFALDKNTILLALGAAFLITFAVLGAAPLYVALLIRAWGRLVGASGPTARLAIMNAARNPQRAAATAVALMLAVGLIITLQVGAASVRETALAQIEENNPIDLVVGTFQTGPDERAVLPADVVAEVESLGNVRSRALLQGGFTRDGQQVVALSPEARQVAPTAPESLPDGVALASPDLVKMQPTLDVTGVDGTMQTLTLQASRVAGMWLVVNEATMRQLVAEPGASMYWIDLVDRENFAATQQQLSALQAKHMNLMVDGAAFQAYLVTQILNIMLMITTALLGVAVAIALVGVANTLGLSVIERTRESALLRALGMQRRRLRLMLLIEAVTLALVGVLVGVVAGVFFAWLGITAVFKEAEIDRDITFAIDWGNTLGLVAIAVVAAALASILPGRKAAMATPTEALAVD